MIIKCQGPKLINAKWITDYEIQSSGRGQLGYMKRTYVFTLITGKTFTKELEDNIDPIAFEKELHKAMEGK